MPLSLSEVSIMDKFSFHCEWFDTKSSLMRKFYLFYFPYDGTIELFDKERRKKFLKRISVEDISLKDIYIGNTIRVFNRQIKITEYANDFTRKVMGESMQKVFVMMKPDGIKNKSKIIKSIIEKGFKISNLRMMNLTLGIIQDIFPEKKGTQEFPILVNSLTSGPVIAMELIGENALENFIEILGPEDPKEAKNSAPLSLRSIYGTNIKQNVFHVADSLTGSDRLISYFFGLNPPASSSETSTVALKDSTCCVIKPHAIKNGHMGEIMCMIEEEGYSISALQMFYIDNVNAEEFFEVYRGVLQEYPEMVSELISGSCLAMEITGMGEKTPAYFRHFIGPTDPDMARQLRPSTLRAIFGENKIKNAVHVTDLPEDGILEVEYFFKILAS